MMEAKYLQKIAEKTSFNMKQVMNIVQLNSEGSLSFHSAVLVKKQPATLMRCRSTRFIEEITLFQRAG
jgi:hypothetical protein